MSDARTAVFIEVCGILIPAHDSSNIPSLLPGVADALKRFQLRGIPVLAFMNAPDLAASDHLRDQIMPLIIAADGAISGWYACTPTSPASWHRPRPGMILTAAKDRDVDLPTSWFVGTRFADAQAAAQAGCAGAVLIGAHGQTDAHLSDDLGLVIAHAHDLADAPRVMIPRGGGCWHRG